MRISDWSSDVCSSDLRVYAAFDKMREQIDRMASQAEFGVGGEQDEVLETYKMFAYDEGWSRRINEAIDSGLTAEAAIEREIGRASGRARGGQYVWIAVVAVALTNK